MAETDNLWTVAQVAKRCSISRSSVYRLVAQGDFPAGVVLGGSRRWRPAEVESHIARCAVST